MDRFIFNLSRNEKHHNIISKNKANPPPNRRTNETKFFLFILFSYSHFRNSVPHILSPALITDYVMSYLVSYLAFFNVLNLLSTNVPHQIETSQLICRANQLTDLYIVGTLVVKRLNYYPWILFNVNQ